MASSRQTSTNLQVGNCRNFRLTKGSCMVKDTSSLSRTYKGGLLYVPCRENICWPGN